jgi:ribose transport system substrate-binding protein
MRLNLIVKSIVVSMALLLLVSCSNSVKKTEVKKVKLAFVTNTPADFWTMARKGTEAADKELQSAQVEFQIADGTAATSVGSSTTC